MEELLKVIASSGLTERVSLLPQAIEYGESGIDFLIECLEDPELEIRATAYQLLQDIESDKVRKAIASGLLFNPGDKIYHVVKSSMWFNDSFYSLCPSKNDSKVINLCTYDDYQSQGYKIIRFEEAAYIVGYAPYYLNYEQAKSKAESLHRKEILEISISEFDLFNLKDQQKVIRQWCQRYQILEEVRCLQIERDQHTGADLFYKTLNIDDDLEEPEHIFWFTVEEYLKSVQNIDLLAQLWQDLIGKLAYVYETCFDKKTYLTVDSYYSQILSKSEGISRYLCGVNEEEISFSSEDAEINLLLTALNNPKLEIRSLAYQLLQGIDSEKAQQAIHQGVKLKPGDKIYSVYQAGICYTDQALQVLWDYVDYSVQLRYQLEGNGKQASPEHSQRIYCFTDRKQADEIAEMLHRKLIKETKISFEWRKENPDFNLKRWCIDNNFSYKSEWDNLDSYEVIWKIKDIIWQDEELRDTFRRSRYIYHPKHIDTWCQDNQVDYDMNVDNWDNYRKVIDYLHLSENIELLSKFWKDGIGNFAFVKEEFVQQTAYIKVGHQLDYQSGEDKLFAVPKEYEAQAGKLLLEILENKKTEKTSRLKARTMLQELDWDEIPF